MNKYLSDKYSKEIITDDEFNPSKVALLENGNLVEFLCLLGPEVPQIGSIHIARVHEVFAQHSLATAEIENGSKISIRLSSEKLRSGDLVTVTITSEPWENKPARGVLGSQLAGKNVILLPNDPKVRRNSNNIKFYRKNKIKEFQNISRELPYDFGFIMRRGSTKVDKSIISKEIKILIEDWKKNAKVCQKSNVIRKPQKLYSGISLIKRAGLIAPDATYQIKKNISDWHIIFEQLDNACDSRLITNREVVIWFQTTKGLTAIDIDSGSSKMGSLEILSHIPRIVMSQIRLRQISGAVFIDIPRASKSDRIKFQQSCQDYALYDMRHPDIHGIGPAGLLEMTISRRYMPLIDRLKILKFIS